MNSNKEIPKNAIKGGNKADGTPYYIGRARHDGKNKELGKVDSSNKNLYTSIGNHVKTWGEYELLVWEINGAPSAGAEPAQTGSSSDGMKLDPIIETLFKRYQGLFNYNHPTLNSLTIYACNKAPVVVTSP